jgi:hypothetical protein
MLTINELAMLLPLLALGAWWWRSRGQHAIAMRGAREYCRERGLQLLDESLVFRNFRIERPLGRKRRLCRVYEFDYSRGGQDRENGLVFLWRDTVLRIILDSEVLEITDYQQ